MPNQTIVRPPTAVRSDGSNGVVQRRVVTVFLVLLAALLAAASARGPIAAILAIFLAVLISMLAVFGRERVAFLAMMAAFATAPMNRGLSPGGPSNPITPTDLLFGLAVMLLLPTLLRRQLRLPLTYVIGITLILVTGTIATAAAAAPLLSALQFAQWLVVILGLLVLFAVWAPSWRMVDILLWSYVAGQMLSILYAPLGGAVGNRYQGLSHHPNEFGGAGVMAFAALMYLWRRNDAVWYRVAVALAASACGVSVVISGSRAATAVMAGLILLIPIVERSAVKGFVLAILGALFVFALPLVVGESGEGSAISRLAGSADALGADKARSEAQDFGIDMFFQHPLLGNGFADALYVHNVVLGVATSIGIFGLIGYLLVLFTLARPVLGNHPNRRLCYVVAAFVAITPTFPGLEDRTLWAPMAPAILLAIQSRLPASDAERDARR
ncbi:hypothetical protein QI633_22445 [Nocardioides sp. QY071]|uniref:O-antigen ligase family protein n=1 Tax=Nocardioides sp. QY071 TaxID=3044187 RepID=UPI00249CB62A|nr:hypothetical protein [Nocardioides sp. QY071]WGY01287.1 hypothetical protein QI633_22445 [Nocardioides sp. QY071]